VSPVSGQKPRVFVSYRYENDEHTAWVQGFVRELETRVIDVVFDQYLDDRRKQAGGLTLTYSQRDGYITRLIGRMNYCHVFMPIFTPHYLAGIGYPEGKPISGGPDVGWVFDEFQLSCARGAARLIETIPILRRGDPRKLPPGFHAGNTLDLRNGLQNIVQKLNGLCLYIHERRLIATVPSMKEYEEFFGGDPWM